VDHFAGFLFDGIRRVLRILPFWVPANMIAVILEHHGPRGFTCRWSAFMSPLALWWGVSLLDRESVQAAMRRREVGPKRNWERRGRVGDRAALASILLL